jgi:T4 RnlA family RNA ligase
MYSVVKDYKIKNIFNKEDGSVASFIMLPDGSVKGRSKASFESDQAIEIQKIYDEDTNIQRFVKWSLSNDIVPIFEFVSPRNRIVLPYTNTKLILLRLRDNNTGEYLDLNDYTDQYDGISVVESENGHTLDSIREVILKSVDKEGVVVQFENGKMVKIKSPWYMSLHGLYTNDLQRENTLISLIVKEQIDDIMSQLNDPLKKEEVDKINNVVNNYIKNISHMVDELVSDYNGSKKDFAIKHHKNKIFSIVMGVINGRDKIDLIKSKILTDTKNLMDARKWLEQHS